jgi:hypothetical protein
MGKVYANSTLNIAASSAPNGEFGCFLARKPDQVSGYKVVARMRWDPAQKTMWDGTVDGFTLREIHNNVLSLRAWVYQEYFLAPRTLHFTENQLSWGMHIVKSLRILSWVIFRRNLHKTWIEKYTVVEQL